MFCLKILVLVTTITVEITPGLLHGSVATNTAGNVPWSSVKNLFFATGMAADGPTSPENYTVWVENGPWITSHGWR